MKVTRRPFPNSFGPVCAISTSHFDPPRPPSRAELILASSVAIVGSLVADMALVAVGTKIFPSVRDYGHFQFSDYAN